MVWIDYAIIGIVIISAAVSLIRGFVKEALSLLTWGLAFFVASAFYKDLAAHFANIAEPMLRNAVAIACLFISTIILGSLFNYSVGQLVEKSGLSGTDKVLGLVFGSLRGVLICAAVLFGMDSFTPASKSTWWEQSLLIPEFGVFIEWFFEYLKTSSSFLKQVKPV